MTDTQIKLVNHLKEHAQLLRETYAIDIKRRGVRLSTVVTAALIDEAIELIEQQDITIRAMMGEFGDTCDAEGCSE